MRLTDKRKKLLRLLEEKNMPLGATEIVSILEEQMDQATVYRNLQLLEEEGMLESFSFRCDLAGEMRYYVYKDDATHRHYFHCEKCHTFIALDECRASYLTKLEEKYGIAIRAHTVHYSGTCSDCRK